VLAVVDTADLVEVVWTSAAACVGITVAYALAIVGADRAVDSSRTGRQLGAAVYGLLCLAAGVVVLAALVLGIVVMVD
jgi:hypothetical protein